MIYVRRGCMMLKTAGINISLGVAHAEFFAEGECIAQPVLVTKCRFEVRNMD